MRNNREALMMKLWIAGIGAFLLSVMAISVLSQQKQEEGKKKDIQTKQGQQTEKSQEAIQNERVNINGSEKTPCVTLSDEGGDEPKLAMNTGNVRQGWLTAGAKPQQIEVTNCATDFELPVKFVIPKTGTTYYRYAAVPNSLVVLANPQEAGKIYQMEVTKGCEEILLSGKFRIDNRNIRKDANSEINIELLEKVQTGPISQRQISGSPASGYVVKKTYRVQVICKAVKLNPVEAKPVGIPKPGQPISGQKPKSNL
ncbi:MAG: hypothetical protein ABI977_07535 [Acidobacteriota bacterium]